MSTKVPVIVSTLGEQLVHGYGLTAYCGCGRSSKVDLAKCAQALGESFQISQDRPRFLRALRCSTCGAAAVSIIISPGWTGPAWADPIRGRAVEVGSNRL